MKIMTIIIIVVMLLGVTLMWKNGMEKVDDYNKYKDFCEERPTYCYCRFGECTFKSSWSSKAGLSQDTKDLCELAEILDDKKMIFDIGCE